MPDQDPGSRKGRGNWAQQSAMALELPFVLAGETVVGGFLGYLLDRWLHTKPWLMLLLGALGFAAGLRDVDLACGDESGPQGDAQNPDNQ